MVIAGLTAKDQRNTRLQTGVLQKLRTKLSGQELIGVAVIDQKIGKPCTILDQRDGVVLTPGGSLFTEMEPWCP